MKAIRLVLLIFTVFYFALITSSCSKNSDLIYSIEGRDSDKYGYDAINSIISNSDYDEIYLNNILYDSDKYFFDITGICTDTFGNIVSEDHLIYSMDADDPELSYINIDSSEVITCIIDDKFYSLNDNKLSIFDSTGHLYMSFDYTDLPFIYNIFSYSDGYILLGDGFIARYSTDGDRLAYIESTELTSYDYQNPAYTDDYNNLFIVKNIGEKIYLKVDFDKGSINEFASSSDFYDYSNMITGRYIIDGYGITKIDISNHKLCKLADYNLINIRPESKRLMIPSITIPADDEHFLKVYVYTDNTIELLSFVYNENLSTDNCQSITVGGYGLSDDLPLRWAAYLYNTEHSESRIYFTDYSMEGFNFNDGISAADSIASLISYFSEGNAPDIFYGSEFDYETMGKSNNVINLSDYINDSGCCNDISENVKNTIINDEGFCYHIYAAYQLDGFFANQENVGNLNISIYDINNLSVQNASLFPVITDYQLLDTIIRYDIPNRLNTYSDHIFSEEELIYALSFCIDNGYENLSNINPINDSYLKLAVIGDVFAYSEYYEEDTFIGYPSFNGSNRIAMARGDVAISASCGDPSAAWNFVEYLLSEDVQKIAISDWCVPVNISVLDQYIDYLKSPDSLPETEEILSFISLYDPVPEYDIDNYYNAVMNISAVRTNDWGIFNIIEDELFSLHSQNKPIDQVAQSLQSRLDLYVAENYN